MADLPEDYDFDQAYERLFIWYQNAFARIDKLGKDNLCRK